MNQLHYGKSAEEDSIDSLDEARQSTPDSFPDDEIDADIDDEEEEEEDDVDDVTTTRRSSENDSNGLSHNTLSNLSNLSKEGECCLPVVATSCCVVCVPKKQKVRAKVD